MPTSPSEVRAMMSVIDKYVNKDDAEKCFAELDDQVGSKSDNLSFKLSTLMLKTIYAQDGRTLETKMEELDAIFKSYYEKAMSSASKGLVALRVVVGLHFAIIVGVLSSIFILPFAAPWYIALPVMVTMVNLMFTRGECAITNLENSIRRKLGLPEIRGFIKHYVIKPIISLSR